MNEILALDLENYEWIKLKELPFSICAHSSVLVNDNIYIYGGTNGQEFFPSLYIFNISKYKLYEIEFDKKEIKDCNL